MAIPLRRTEEKSISIKSTFQLPTAMTEPKSLLEENTWMIYSPKKIGKTSLAAQFPKSLIFSFEPASRRVRAYQVDCPTWADFKNYVSLLEREKHDFRTAVLDTGFDAYNRCLEYVCEINNIKHPSDKQDFGGTWKKVGDEFRAVQNKIAALGMGIVVICHDKAKENETFTGQRFDQVIPKLSNQADDYYRAALDNVIYFHKRGAQRFLTIRGTDYIFAGVSYGDEISPAFRTPDGEMIASIYAGDSAQDAFNNLKEAFECKIEETFSDETKIFEEESIKQSIRNKLKKGSKK